MSVEEVPKTQIAIKLQQALDERGMDLQGFAKEFDVTYEYARRILRGKNLPSKTILKLFCFKFGWKFGEMEKVLVQDRFRVRNGEQGGIAQEFNPEVEPFERAWHLLDQQQKDILLAQFNMFVAQNRKFIKGSKADSDSVVQ